MKKLVNGLKRIFVLLMALMMVGSCVQPVNEPVNGLTVEAKAPAGFKVVGYIPDYKDCGVDLVQYGKLTHINYSFAIPNADGSLKPLERPAQLQQLVAKAHAHGVKVLIAVGGWSWNGTPLDSTFETLGKNASSRARLIQEIVALVEQYNLDGADMDWEFPDPKQEGNGSADAFSALMSELSQAMKARGKLTTAAVHAGVSPTIDDFYWAYGVQDDVFTSVDWLNLMAYDGGNGDVHSPYSLAERCLNYWITIRGLAPEKAALGVPFYARPSWKSYAEIVAEDPDAPNKDVSAGRYYNGIATIKAKTNLAMTRAGGIMIWEISQDTHDSTSLLSAIADTVGIIVTPTPSPTIDPNITPTPTPTATPAPACTLPEYVQGNVYTGGMEVHYDGNDWKAKWWTQNEAPSTAGSGVWEHLGVCGGTTSTPTPTATAVIATPTATATTIVVTPTATATAIAITPTATATAVINTPTPTPDTGVHPWAPGVAYVQGNVVSYNGVQYTCHQPHTSLAGWEPANVPALWSVN